MTSLKYASVYAFQQPPRSVLTFDLVQLLNHQPENPFEHCPPLLSLSWSIELNCIPLFILFGWTGAEIASPVSPLNPDTLRRYLSLSGPTANDEYSTDSHTPVSRWIWKSKCCFQWRLALNYIMNIYWRHTYFSKEHSFRHRQAIATRERRWQARPQHVIYIVFQKLTRTYIIGFKLRSSCLILIIFDTIISHII